MVAPQDWLAPASGGTVTDSYTVRNVVTHAGDYWFAATLSESGSNKINLKVRYASDPTGAWGTATLPAAPTGYTTSVDINYATGVVSDGSAYGLLAIYSNGTATKRRVLHCTDPSSTWTSYEFDSSDQYRARTLAYGNGTWVLAGHIDTGSGDRPAAIGTASTVNGTYTWGTATSSTGYDVTAISGTSANRRRWDINNVVWDGTQWVTSAYPSRDVGLDGIKYSARYSTSITGSWGTASSFPSTGFAPPSNYDELKYHNGYWTLLRYDVDFQASSTITGTWSSLVPSVGFQNDIAYGNGLWIATRDRETPDYNNVYIAYLESTTTPVGTYTPLTGLGFTGPAESRGIAYYGGYFVAGTDYYGELRYYRAAQPQRFLRQRQSPRATPQRVNRPTLRQRQTFR